MPLLINLTNETISKWENNSKPKLNLNDFLVVSFLLISKARAVFVDKQTNFSEVVQRTYI